MECYNANLADFKVLSFEIKEFTKCNIEIRIFVLLKWMNVLFTDCRTNRPIIFYQQKVIRNGWLLGHAIPLKDMNALVHNITNEIETTNYKQLCISSLEQIRERFCFPTHETLINLHYFRKPPNVRNRMFFRSEMRLS